MDMKVTLSDDFKTLICSKCGIEKLTSQFYASKRHLSGFRSECKCCSKLYREANKERQAELNKKWYEANKERQAELNKKWYEANKERQTELRKKWQTKNKDLVRSYKSKRRSAKLKAFPKWVNQAELNLIADLYTGAKNLEVINGESYHVDHIHPLQHDLVCGLHCISNLQILTASENLSKSNKFEPYVESDLDFNNLLPWQK